MKGRGNLEGYPRQDTQWSFYFTCPFEGLLLIFPDNSIENDQMSRKKQ